VENIVESLSLMQDADFVHMCNLRPVIPLSISSLNRRLRRFSLGALISAPSHQILATGMFPYKLYLSQLHAVEVVQ